MPLTGIRGSEQRISGGGTPNRCPETDSHAIPQAFVLPSHWCHPSSSYCHPQCPTGLSFLLLLFSFFVPIASFPQTNFAPGSPRKDDRQLGQPTTSPVLSLLMRISLSQSRSLPTSDCLQEEILPFSDLRCTAFPAVSSASPPRQRFRSESRLVDQDSQGYEFCACDTGMTDVVFQVEVQKRRIQMIDAKAASN